MADSGQFWLAFSAISQAVAAFATFLAVAASLWIALSERRPRLRVGARLMAALGGTLPTELDVIQISVVNIGQRQAKITSIGWRVGWLDRGPKWLKRTYLIQMFGDLPWSQDPPYDLPPSERANSFISAGSYLADLNKGDNPFKLRKLPLLNRSLVPRIRVDVFTAEGHRFSAKADNRLAQSLVAGRLIEPESKKAS